MQNSQDIGPEKRPGDEIQGTVGDESRNVSIGKDIHQETHESRTGDVNVNIGGGHSWSPPPRHKRIMPEVEQELRGYIYRLTEAVNRLEVTLEKNNAISTEQLGVLREQVRSVREQADLMKGQLQNLSGLNIITPVQSSSGWSAHIMLFLLSTIATVLIGLLVAVMKIGGWL